MMRKTFTCGCEIVYMIRFEADKSKTLVVLDVCDANADPIAIPVSAEYSDFLSNYNTVVYVAE